MCSELFLVGISNTKKSSDFFFSNHTTDLLFSRDFDIFLKYLLVEIFGDKRF